MYGSFHGGQFWEKIGPKFEDLDRREGVINADVLDAWFDPAPEVVEALANNHGWMARTSPPTYAEGLRAAIAESRELPVDSVLPGPGSSALLFLAWRSLLARDSRVLLLEPTYGEYEYLASEVVGANVDRFDLPPNERFAFDPSKWLNHIERTQADIAVLVNPNNPTGTRFGVEDLVRAVPKSTLVWIDEAYVDYTDCESADRLAAILPNVIVLKSLSKVCALSGIRAAYMVANRDLIARFQQWVPPWWISLPAQVAAIAAMNCSAYYASKFEETRQLRIEFEDRLAGLPVTVVGSEANWVLVELAQGVSAEKVRMAMETQGIYVRNAGLTAFSLGDSYLRIAVKPAVEQERIVSALAAVLHPITMSTDSLKVGL